MWVYLQHDFERECRDEEERLQSDHRAEIARMKSSLMDSNTAERDQIREQLEKEMAEYRAEMEKKREGQMREIQITNDSRYYSIVVGLVEFDWSI